LNAVVANLIVVWSENQEVLCSGIADNVKRMMVNMLLGKLRAVGLGPAKIREPADSEIGLEMDL
jgi:hypothetical protein